MGKLNGQCAYMYIAPSGCRVVEGVNKSGEIDVDKYFTIVGIEGFFTQTPTGYEISNMSGLVSAIVDEMDNRNVSTSRVFITSECLKVSVKLQSETPKGGLKSFLAMDFGGKKKKNKENTEAKVKTTPGRIQSKCSWGDVIIDGKLLKYVSTSDADKFTMKSMVDEFYKHKFEVVGISDTISQLFNLRQTQPATFDSQGKIIFDLSDKLRIIVMVKDVPVEYTENGLPHSSIQTFIKQSLMSKLNITGRNPLVYLTGEGFSKLDVYASVINELEPDYKIYDMFELPAADDEYFDKIRRGEEPPLITPDYSACFAQLLMPYSKHVINLLPPMTVGEQFKRHSVGVSRGVLAVSLICFITMAALTGWRVVELLNIKSDPSSVSGMQSQISTLTAKKSQLNETMKTLTQADMTVLNVMDFVVANSSSVVNIISVDTKDVLDASVLAQDGSISESPEGMDTGTTTASTEEAVDGAVEGAESAVGEVAGEVSNIVSGVVGDVTGSVRTPIIIRGYARTGNAAVEYYNSLFNYGLPSDPILKGVEQYTLPAGQIVYIFEIQIGGD